MLALVSGLAFAGDFLSRKALEAIRKSKVADDNQYNANAIAIRDAAIDDISDAGILLLTRALQLQRNGKDDAAIADFSPSVELGFRPALAYASRGTSPLSGADLNPAIADFDSPLRLDPKLAFAHLICGRLMCESGRLSDATGDFAIAIQPRG